MSCAQSTPCLTGSAEVLQRLRGAVPADAPAGRGVDTSPQRGARRCAQTLGKVRPQRRSFAGLCSRTADPSGAELQSSALGRFPGCCGLAQLHAVGILQGVAPSVLVQGLGWQMLDCCFADSDEDAGRHGMCVGIVTSQREGGVGLGYLHQSLASLITGAPSLLHLLRTNCTSKPMCEPLVLTSNELVTVIFTQFYMSSVSAPLDGQRACVTFCEA